MVQRYFEDFTVGEAIPLGSHQVTRAEIIAFAAEFDPQPFHLDERQGSGTMVDGLIASGWHVSGLFMRIESLPPALQGVARVLPLTYAVSLLQGIWAGDAWSAHLGDLAALAAVCLVCTALSAKVFRWE